MNKKKVMLISVLIILIFAFLFMFYYFSETANYEKKKSIIDKSESIAENNEQLFSYGSGMEITDLKNSYTYNGEEITLTVQISNEGDQFDETFLLYVNGMQNMYHTDTESTESVYHTITIPAEETVTTQIIFKPQNCEIGETVFVSLERMMNMSYMLPDTSYVNFYPNHEINGIMPFKMDIKKNCTKSDQSSVDNSSSWKSQDLTNEIIEDNIVFDEQGNPTSQSYLDNNSYFDLYQNERLDSYFSTSDDKINLTLDAYGKSGRYRVGVYLDHVLQPAFDGKYYSDVEINRDTMQSRNVTIDLSDKKGLHCVYAIAIPIEDSTLFTIKTTSRLLSIEDEQNTDESSAKENIKENLNESKADNDYSKDVPINNVSNIIDIGDDFILLTNGNEGTTYNIINGDYASNVVDIPGGDTVQAIESGFAVIGLNGSYINIYDRQCNLMSNIIPPQHDCGVYSVAYDGKRIVYSYSDESGNTYLYTDNTELTDKKLVKKYTMSEKLNTIQGITNIYLYKDNVISFEGSVLVQNNPQNFSSCMGVINENSGETSFYTINGGYYLSANLSPQLNYFIEIQDFNMDKSADGIINYSSYSEIDVKTFNCKSAEESHYATISENGLYISTLTDTPGTLRIYDLKTSELLSEFDVDATSRNIILNEKTKTVYFISENGMKKRQF